MEAIIIQLLLLRTSYMVNSEEQNKVKGVYPNSTGREGNGTIAGELSFS